MSTAIRRGVSAAVAPVLSVAGLLTTPPSAHAAETSTVTDLRQAWQIREQSWDETAADQTTTQVHLALVALGHGPAQRADHGGRAAHGRRITIDAHTLSRAMGGSLPLARYRQLAPAFTRALAAAHCNTVRRVAMFCAQVGHESLGLRYMEEIASGSAYNWRADLGNTHPGDGQRFKGRGPIQVTGRATYREVSEWAHARRIVPTRDYFLDHPARLASDRYGFVGAVWYWTRARHMNSYADRSDIRGATRAVNGGTNGLHDRIVRWHHCLRLGGALLRKV